MAAFFTLGDGYARRRYLELRELESRTQRFDIERIATAATAAPTGAAILLTIEGVDLGAWMDPRGPRLEEALGLHAAGAKVHPTTLDSWRAIGRICRVEVSPPEATIEAWASVLARELGADGVGTVAVTGRPLPEAWAATGVFLRSLDDYPTLTDFLHEGDAAWVTAEAVRQLDRPRQTAVLVWLGQVEPDEPHLPQLRFKEWGVFGSEVVSVDHYFGRLLAYLGRVGLADAPILLAALDPAGDAARVLAVHVDVPEQGTLGDLARALAEALSPRASTSSASEAGEWPR